MESQSISTPENHGDKKRFGFCLPCYGFPKIAWGQDNLNQFSNPFPLIKDLGMVYSILPIKAYWIPPLKTTYDYLSLLLSHESVHLALLNTCLSYYTLVLIQFQYVAIIKSLHEGRRIYIPSLNDSSGWLIKTQEALDLVDEPMALIHELMAASLVRFFTEQNIVCMTSQLLQLIFRVEISSDRLNELRFLPIDQASLGLLKLVQEMEEKSWIPHYSSMFPGYDFPQLYHRLLACWFKVAVSVEEKREKWTPIVEALVKYPFNIPEHSLSGWFAFPSFDSCLDMLVRHVTQMRGEPLRRLNDMLMVIENAPGFHSDAEWMLYLMKELPGFGQSVGLGYGKAISQAVEHLWQEHGNPNLASLFRWFYSHEYYGTGVFSPQKGVIDEGLGKIAPKTRSMVVLETMRQSLLVGSGLTCLCSPQLQNICFEKRLLFALWQLSTPDAGHELWYEHQWRKPTCFSET